MISKAFKAPLRNAFLKKGCFSQIQKNLTSNKGTSGHRLQGYRSFFSSSRYGSSSSNYSSSPFGPSPYKWFLKNFLVCGLAAIAISTTETSDLVLEECCSKIAELWANFEGLLDKYNLKLPEAFAFSVPDHGLHPPHYDWDHKKFYRTYDHEAIRRGFQVYREVCSACHGIKQLCFRNLIGVSHTEDEVRQIASEYQIVDGPDDTGEMFERPGRPADRIPGPYPNDEAARAANNGAVPPDLSCIVRARHGEEDYIFSLLTGYHDPPPGMELRDGMSYNPFFPGGAISMAQPLTDGTIDYDDGTPNTMSQLAKDVTCFLTWASYPEHDERKKFGTKTMLVLVVLLGATVWWKRFKWSYLKTRRIVFKPGPRTEI